MDSYRYVGDKLWVGQVTRLSTDDGGFLSLAPAEFIPYEFSFGIKDKGEEVDILHSLVRLTDGDGRVWEGEAIWNVPEIAEQMTNLGSDMPPVSFDDAPSDWKEAFRDTSFFSGARGLLDDRFYRSLLLEGQIFDIQFKYQGITLDLAFIRDESVWLVEVLARVGGLYAFPPRESDNLIYLPQIVFKADVHSRLFVNYGYQETSGRYEFDIIPRPFVLKATSLTGSPNPLIQHQAG